MHCHITLLVNFTRTNSNLDLLNGCSTYNMDMNYPLLPPCSVLHGHITLLVNFTKTNSQNVRGCNYNLDLLNCCSGTIWICCHGYELSTAATMFNSALAIDHSMPLVNGCLQHINTTCCNHSLPHDRLLNNASNLLMRALSFIAK